MPNNWEVYAPYLVIFVIFATTYKIFVTPNQLNDKINELEDKIKKDYASKEIVDNIVTDVKDIKKKIDKIYDLLITGKINNND